MKKLAVLINGVSAPIKKHNFLSGCLEELGFEVKTVNLVGENIKLEKDDIADFVANLVANRQVDLIMGWSLGALVAPLIIKNYPKAKLILVASGVGNLNKLKYLNPMIGWLRHGLNLPSELLMTTYEKINPVGDGVKHKYRLQMEENIDFFRTIGTNRLKEIFDFLAKVDNRQILKEIKNKTLVVSGKNDKLFPLNEGEKLSKLLENGRWVVTEGGHYDVIGVNELPILREFLES